MQWWAPVRPNDNIHSLPVVHKKCVAAADREDKVFSDMSRRSTYLLPHSLLLRPSQPFVDASIDLFPSPPCVSSQQQQHLIVRHVNVRRCQSWKTRRNDHGLWILTGGEGVVGTVPLVFTSKVAWTHEHLCLNLNDTYRTLTVLLPVLCGIGSVYIAGLLHKPENPSLLIRPQTSTTAPFPFMQLVKIRDVELNAQIKH